MGGSDATTRRGTQLVTTGPRERSLRWEGMEHFL
jgi:hypothetical protein